MSAGGYADDFARFLRAGRIGGVCAEMDIELQADKLVPSVGWVRGHIHIEQAQLRSLSWRIRGELAWTPVQLGGDSFAIATPGRAGTMELRSVGVPLDGSSELVAWAFAELAWPEPEIQIGERPNSVERNAVLRIGLRAQWVEQVAVTFDDAGSERHAFQPGQAGAIDFVAPTSVIGQHRIRLAWLGCDGSEGFEVLEYTVTARAIQMEIRRLQDGALQYSARHADALELHLPGSAAPLLLPMAGVIDSTLLMPLHAVLRYRDEAGQWCDEPLLFDYSPRRWTAQRGFAGLGPTPSQTPSNPSRRAP